jgi:uncharacterized protein (TIGR02266 family)
LSTEDNGSREFPRVEATFKVSYPTIDQLLIAYSSDLSKGGMFLQTDHFLPVNAVVRVQLELAEGSEIPVICRVAYVRDTATALASNKPAGMGIEFLDLSAECLKLIEVFIAERVAAAAEAPGGPAARRLNVLIADDDLGCRTLASAPFRQRGDYVRVATDGFDALAQCLKERPDVIISDVHMPRIDGWQLLRLVRARPTLASVPFLFLTTLTGEEERLRGYQLGVDDYIAKPFRGRELQARVDRMIARVARVPGAHAERKTLRGDLQQVSLPSVLSFLELERKTGELMVLGDKKAHLFLRDGRLLRIEREDLPGASGSLELLYDVLSWRSGQFEFATHEVSAEDLFDTTITAILMEHARFTDEKNR